VDTNDDAEAETATQKGGDLVACSATPVDDCRTEMERPQQRSMEQIAACRRAFLGGSVVKRRRSGADARLRKRLTHGHEIRCT
jgi:hypothetical protein